MTQRSHEPKGNRFSVVIIEDSFAVADSLRALLEVLGCRIVGMAGHASRALELVEREHFDLAILDIQLGSSNVGQVAEVVHARGIPIIYISGYEDLAVLPEHLRSEPLLPKPVNPEDLAELLDTFRNAAPPRP